MSDGPAIPTYGPRYAQRAAGFLDQVGHLDLDTQISKLDATVTSSVVDEMKAQRAQIVAIARTLVDPERLPLLEWLLDITLRRPLFLPNLGEQSAHYCALREGQNQVAWQLLRAIAEGRSEQQPHREGQ